MYRRQFLAALLVSATAARAGGGSSAADKLDRIIRNYVATGRLAGAAVAIADAGQSTRWLQAGHIAKDVSVAFTRDSLCRIYSMTKPVTGLAVMLLIEDGLLHLDQPVADILPELRRLWVAVDPRSGLEGRPATRSMTIRHLLTHSSGLAYWTPLTETDALSTAYRARGITPGNFYPASLTRPGYGPQAQGLAEMVKRLAELPLAAEPGTEWRYSVGLDVLGLVVERASGKSLDRFVADRIFTPLGMTSTWFVVPDEQKERLTSNYSVTPSGLVDLDPGTSSVFLKPPALLAGGAGLISTARDFSRFGIMLAADGRLGRVRIAKSDTVRYARSNLLPPDIKFDGGGFGAGMRVAQGGLSVRDAVGAMSWNGAAGTMWLVDPARGLNLVLMSQFMPPTAYPIWTEVADALH